MARLTTYADGFSEASQFVRRLRQRQPKSEARLMRRIGAYGVSSTLERIKSDGLGVANSPLTKAVKRGDVPLLDRGRFIRTVTFETGETPSGHYAAWGSNALQAGLLQAGGEVKAKRAKKLAFPASKRTLTLQRKFGPTIEKTIRGMRRAGFNVWVMDGAIMAQKKGRRTKPFALYIRRKKVTIPAYRPFRLDADDDVAVVEMIDDFLREISGP